MPRALITQNTPYGKKNVPVQIQVVTVYTTLLLWIYQHDFSSPKLFQPLIILYSKIQFSSISDLTAKNIWSLEGR